MAHSMPSMPAASRFSAADTTSPGLPASATATSIPNCLQNSVTVSMMLMAQGVVVL